MKTIIAIVFLFYSLIGYTQSVKTYIPEKAYRYLPTIYEELDRIIPGFPYPYYVPALIEHESCISLKSKRCFDPTSELLTKREQGTGFFQLTRTFREDGSTRFDVLSDMKKRYQADLKELAWGNIKQRPDLQIRSGVLLIRENYKSFYMISDNFERVAMADSAHNGGKKDVMRSRTVCGLAKNCDPQKWFLNTEKYCVKSKKPLYAGRSACDINTHHPRDVMFTRMSKYKQHYQKAES